MYIGNGRCDPPKHLRQDDLTFGNTYLRNQYCIDNPNFWEVLAISQFLGYLCFDIVLCSFFIGDFKSPAALQNMMHHAIGILGSIWSLIVGRYIVTLSVASMINELSTPNVNMRWFLY